MLPRFAPFALIAVSLASGAALPPPDPNVRDADGQPYLDKFLQATRSQDEKLRGIAMVCDIEASLPSMNKKGKFHALRQISKLGQVTYKKITFQGDNTIKNDVIARYLNAEKEAAEKGGNLGRNLENYKFKYYGEFPWGPTKLHLFALTPRQKRAWLFEGWLWVEHDSGLPVREQGTLVKNPSVFLKHVDFVRDYEHKDGVAVPVKVDSSIQTRIVGTAELSIRYSQLEVAADDASLAAR